MFTRKHPLTEFEERLTNAADERGFTLAHMAGQPPGCVIDVSTVAQAMMR